ncbi:MAG: tRNA (adenosine(37)-N6)-threonylcarbamoyltransferase complex ATPase subunit type 1 TsaE [Clostridia bacterium]|nr:tRNA (adenosine(37)-N6)-threonylcarbamoyltransferase complex ATPase subunit type 1 TsaE [Clostridia bacterium]MBR2927091.1 tRNA (adenosine(37)-N6)-threonylcarbamoyltransferase complex ATPase subunit type 1 TsaE [Clostridia bacterium]
MPFEQLCRTSCVEETEACGAMLADRICKDPASPCFVALYGDLGVGKTAFVRGFASVISPGSAVRSPTFALVNEYRGKGRPLFHFDMYRITSEEDLYSIGFYDYADRGGICLVEWSENIPDSLPSEYWRVEIKKEPERSFDARSIQITLIEEETA